MVCVWCRFFGISPGCVRSGWMSNAARIFRSCCLQSLKATTHVFIPHVRRCLPPHNRRMLLPPARPNQRLAQPHFHSLGVARARLVAQRHDASQDDNKPGFMMETMKTSHLVLLPKRNALLERRAQLQRSALFDNSVP